jgi:CIC family chloride channel protein
VRNKWQHWLDNFGIRLSGIDALPQLSLLAIPVGLLAGSVIILLRLLIAAGQSAYLPGEEAFESLPLLWRLLLPLLGGLFIGLAWQALQPAVRVVGVIHVMQRLAYHQGRLPLANAIAQFCGTVACLVSGQSVGREGPCVHLGAASGSLLGQWLHLPDNSNRTLAACGIAAAIAASFNTPLAGVIFAMEVVMMEYSLLSFAPVILSAVIATTLTHAVFGDSPVFLVPTTQLGSLYELPYIALSGVVLGSLAALFIKLLQQTGRQTRSWPVWLRCTLGGGSVGLIAMVVPEVMGVGYDTVNQALLGQLGLAVLAGIALAKLFATGLGLGLGLPGGLIGPTLVIGALAGGAMGLLADSWLPGKVATPAFYALIGMGTFMAATLQAPLAALTAMLELTVNPHIILPGMLSVIVAGLVSREIFGCKSVYLVLSGATEQDYLDSPVTRALRNIGVASVMERRIETLPRNVERTRAAAALDGGPRWLLVMQDSTPVAAMPAADLAHHLQSVDDAGIDLAEIPARRHDIAAVDFQATLLEARDRMQEHGVQLLYVTRNTVPGMSRIFGVISKQDIDGSYKTG